MEFDATDSSLNNLKWSLQYSDSTFVLRFPQVKSFNSATAMMLRELDAQSRILLGLDEQVKEVGL